MVNTISQTDSRNLPDPSGWAVAVAVSSGAAALVVMLLATGALIPTQGGAWICYVGAPIVVPLLGAGVYRAAIRRSQPQGLPTGTVVTLAASVVPVFLLWIVPATTRLDLIALALCPLLALGLRPWAFGPSRAAVDEYAQLIVALLVVLVFGFTIQRDAPVPLTPGTATEWAVALVLVTGYVVLTADCRRTLTTKLGWVADTLACGAVFLCVVSVRTFLAPVGRFHINYYLGPTNDVFHGRTMLVDTSSQYGVAVIYWLAAFMRFTGPRAMYAASLTAFTVLTAAMCVCAYIIVRRLGSGRALACAATLVVVSVCVYGPADYFYEYPSTGSLRFGLPTLMVIWISLSGGTNQWLRRITAWLQLVTLALATVWSAETFIYTGAVFGAGILATSLEPRRSGIMALARNIRWSVTVQVTVALVGYR